MAPHTRILLKVGRTIFAIPRIVPKSDRHGRKGGSAHELALFAAQFKGERIVARFELTLQDEEVKVVEERHYRLSPATDLDEAAIRGDDTCSMFSLIFATRSKRQWPIGIRYL